MKTFLATTQPEFEAAKKLFLEYAGDLGFGLEFQDFDGELKSIAVQYGPPSGGLILLEENNSFVGCTAIRRLEPGVGELKRMYIQPEFREQGFGKILLKEAIALAVDLNYGVIRLDTLSTMEVAMKLYKAAGFAEIQPYRFNPLEGARYFELKLK